MINSPIVNDRPRREAAAIEAFLESPNEESFTKLFLTLTPRLVSFFRSHGCAMDVSEDIGHYIDGSFVESHGTEVMDIIKPTNGQVIGRVTLADEEDTKARHRRSQERIRRFRPIDQGRAHEDPAPAA
jgi:hypothetical protein